MTRVVFEATALADALKKAQKVAPTRGDSFEKAAGIFLDITSEEVVVMATDTLTRFATWLTPESVEGPPTKWRISSRIFPEVIGKLKTTMTRTLSLEQVGGNLTMQHGRTKAQFRLMGNVNEYPTWMPFSPDDMKEVEGLAGIASAVQWACSKGTDVPYTGIHFDGAQAIATDKYRFAVMPCELPIDKAMTIPAGALTSILKPNETVLLRSDGSQLYVMPDEFTQISMTMYGVDYPNMSRVMRREYPCMVKVQKDSFRDMLDLAVSMVGSDRLPTMVLIFGRQQVAAMLENEQEGLLGHVHDVPGQLDFARRDEVRFKPESLIGAVDGCPAAEITLGYDPANTRAAFYIKGGDGLEFWISPRQKTETTSE